MKTKQHKKGFTLVELMITAAASAILILTVALILMLVFKSWRINNAYADLRRDAALAVYLMARDVRESTLADVKTYTDPDQLVLPTVTYEKTAGGALTSTDFGTIIPGGVTTFVAQTNGPSDGVYIMLEVTNSTFNIGIANEVFVNTRN